MLNKTLNNVSAITYTCKYRLLFGVTFSGISHINFKTNETCEHAKLQSEYLKYMRNNETERI